MERFACHTRMVFFTSISTFTNGRTAVSGRRPIRPTPPSNELLAWTCRVDGKRTNPGTRLYRSGQRRSPSKWRRRRSPRWGRSEPKHLCGKQKNNKQPTLRYSVDPARLVILVKLFFWGRGGGVGGLSRMSTVLYVYHIVYYCTTLSIIRLFAQVTSNYSIPSVRRYFSLRSYAVQMLTPARILAETSGRTKVKNVQNTHTHTHTHTPWEDQREWHRMTRMTRPDCAVMCNSINTHTHTHTHPVSICCDKRRETSFTVPAESGRSGERSRSCVHAPF